MPIIKDICKGRTSIVKRKLKRGANPNALNWLGYTALQVACIQKRWDIIPLLIAAGADITLKGLGNLHTLALAKAANAPKDIIDLLTIEGSKKN